MTPRAVALLLCLSAGLAACPAQDADPDGAAATDAASDLGDAAPDAPCVVCSIWQVRCGDRCVDLTTSPENCGACGFRCDARAPVCRGGVCASLASRCASLATPDAGAPGDAATPDAAPPDDAPPPDDAGATTGGGLRGEYYGTTSLVRLRLVRTDPGVSFDWSMTAPDPAVGRENFSVRWVGQVTARYSETYTFATVSDDGVRLWVDGQPLVDNWTPHGAMEDRGTIALTAGRPVELRLEYFQGMSAATIQLYWSSTSQVREVVPASRLAPGAGTSFACDEGVCCPAGTGTPVCCPAGTRCVANARFSGCCPNDEDCGAAPGCPPPRP